MAQETKGALSDLQLVASGAPSDLHVAASRPGLLQEPSAESLEAVAISEEASVHEDKAKLVFERKRGGEKRVRCVVQAFKRMFQKEIDFEQLPGTSSTKKSRRASSGW